MEVLLRAGSGRSCDRCAPTGGAVWPRPKPPGPGGLARSVYPLAPRPSASGFRIPATRCAYRWRTARSALNRSRLSHSSPTDLLWDCRGRLNPAHVSFRNRVQRRAETAVLIRDGCTWETCPKAYFPYLGRGLLGLRGIVGIDLTSHAWERTRPETEGVEAAPGGAWFRDRRGTPRPKRNVPRGLPGAHD